MSIIKTIFTPDHVRYEGVRPINIYLLRVLYFLMFIGVAVPTWSTIINHQGEWDHVQAVAYCVWAAYPTLSLLGLIKPLRWLPLIFFTVFYKTVWLIIVAYPLWRANALYGSPAAEMAHVFFWTPVVLLIVPWKYVFQNYVMWSKPKTLR